MMTNLVLRVKKKKVLRKDRKKKRKTQTFLCRREFSGGAAETARRPSGRRGAHRSAAHRFAVALLHSTVGHGDGQYGHSGTQQGPLGTSLMARFYYTVLSAS